MLWVLIRREYCIATDKRRYMYLHNIFLISLQKHMLWYSLEAPTHQGASDEYPQHVSVKK